MLPFVCGPELTDLAAEVSVTAVVRKYKLLIDGAVQTYQPRFWSLVQM